MFRTEAEINHARDMLLEFAAYLMSQESHIEAGVVLKLVSVLDWIQCNRKEKSFSSLIAKITFVTDQISADHSS